VHTRIFAEKARQAGLRAAARTKAAGALATGPSNAAAECAEAPASAAEEDAVALASSMAPSDETLLATEILVDTLAQQSFAMLRAVNSNKYLFAHFFPFAAAAAVHDAFVYLLPGSRAAYTGVFRLEVFLMVARLLSGVELAPVTCVKMMATLFPDERASVAVREEMAEAAAAALARGSLKGSGAKKEGGAGGDGKAGGKDGAKAEGGGADGDAHGDPNLRALGDKRSQAWAKALGFRSAFALFQTTSLADRGSLGLAQTAHVELLRKLDRTTTVPPSAFLITGASVPKSNVTASANVSELLSPAPEQHAKLYKHAYSAVLPAMPDPPPGRMSPSDSLAASAALLASTLQAPPGTTLAAPPLDEDSVTLARARGAAPPDAPVRAPNHPHARPG
jgi:hypothetical protein